jgi:hypothetical protein
LEGVVVLPIDECNVDGKFRQSHRSIDSGEASAKDHDSLAYVVASRHIYGSFACSGPFFLLYCDA